MAVPYVVSDMRPWKWREKNPDTGSILAEWTKKKLSESSPDPLTQQISTDKSVQDAVQNTGNLSESLLCSAGIKSDIVGDWESWLLVQQFNIFLVLMQIHFSHVGRLVAPPLLLSEQHLNLQSPVSYIGWIKQQCAMETYRITLNDFSHPATHIAVDSLIIHQ